MTHKYEGFIFVDRDKDLCMIIDGAFIVFHPTSIDRPFEIMNHTESESEGWIETSKAITGSKNYGNLVKILTSIAKELGLKGA